MLRLSLNPLLPKQLIAVIGQRHISMAYRTGLIRKTLVFKHLHISTQGNTNWQALLGGLQQELAGLKLAPQTQFHIALQSDLVKYLVLPPSQVLMKRAEKLAYATAAYGEVHGNEAHDWQICYGDAAPHQYTLAAAIDYTAINAMTEFSQRNRLQLVSVQPYLAAVLARLKHKLKQAAILVVVESDRLVCARLDAQGLAAVRVLRHGENWAQTMMQHLQRDALLNPSLPKTIYLYAPTIKHTALPQYADWQIKQITLSDKPALAQALLEPLL